MSIVASAVFAIFTHRRIQIPFPGSHQTLVSASATHTTLMKTPSHINTYLFRRVLPDYYLKHLQ